jgi:Type IX secretion system membrane protein PorP/SprF
LAQYKNFYAGIAIFHLTQPDIGINGKSNLPSSLNIHASYTKKFSEKIITQFFALYNKQDSYNKIQFQSNSVLLSHFVLGLGADSHEQLNISAGYRNNYISTLLSFGYSWSKLAGAPNQAINLSLALK